MATRSSILVWRIRRDRGARRAAVRRVTKSQTQLSAAQHSTWQLLIWPLDPRNVRRMIEELNL